MATGHDFWYTIATSRAFPAVFSSSLGLKARGVAVVLIRWQQQYFQSQLLGPFLQSSYVLQMWLYSIKFYCISLPKMRIFRYTLQIQNELLGKIQLFIYNFVAKTQVHSARHLSLFMSKLHICLKIIITMKSIITKFE